MSPCVGGDVLCVVLSVAWEFIVGIVFYPMPWVLVSSVVESLFRVRLVVLCMVAITVGLNCGVRGAAGSWLIGGWGVDGAEVGPLSC